MKQVVTTMITPYAPDGSVDLDTAARYVEWYAAGGCTGIFSLCQSSEIFFLSLEERIALQRTVWQKAQEIERRDGKRPDIIASGHVSADTDAAAEELNAVINEGADALVLITNRLDPKNEGDAVWIANAEKLLARLPAGLSLGLYECPHPYKRLLTPEILRWCISTGRFRYIKDTCCDFNTIAERAALLEGSGTALLNANCQTLLDSLIAGADGYCGIMANLHPKLYVWLCENYERSPQQAAFIQSILCSAGFIESAVSYPMSAKYHMCLEGIPTCITARCAPDHIFSDYEKSCVKQLKLLTDVVCGSMLA